MKRAELLQKIDAAIRKRNPVLAEHYLRPGLTKKAIERLLKNVTGLTEPLFELYSWHDGTKFVHLAPGETYKTGIKKVELFPGHRFHFVNLKLAVLGLEALAKKAEHKLALKEGVGKYLPFFYNGATAEFMLDLQPERESRVMFFDSQEDKPVQQAYETLDAFLAAVLHANEANKPLGFFQHRKLKTEKGIKGSNPNVCDLMESVAASANCAEPAQGSREDYEKNNSN